MDTPDSETYGIIEYYGIQVMDEAGNLSRVVSVPLESVDRPGEAPEDPSQQSVRIDSGLCFMTAVFPVNE